MNQFDLTSFLHSLTSRPGIYQMIDNKGTILYVGKAKDLKKRVTSYFHRKITDVKTQVLLSQIDSVNVIITNSENEALLLENNLIKQHRPRYNILLRDDKSYPYLFLSAHKDFPRLDFHRGPQREPGRYFGPYPSAKAVRESLTLLQKLFKIRQCTDSFFKNRTRPCLQYYIDRCTAPCVGYVDKKTYLQNVHYAVLFLEGKNTEIIKELTKKMEEASASLNYENAARYRDQIALLHKLQEQQYVSRQGGDFDVIAIAQYGGEACVHLLFIRNGRIIGDKAFFPNVPIDSTSEEVLTAFLPQFYLNPTRGESIPSQVIVNIHLKEKKWIENALAEALGRKIEIVDTNVRGQKKQWIHLAATNAEHTLKSHLAGKASYYNRMLNLQESLQLANLPQRLECFDVSHTLGEATYASCVVFDTEGPVKKDYRRFKIEGIQKGDDYAALEQALTRRYTRLKAGEAVLPDILFIDGGKGQLHKAEKVLEELQVSGVILIAIAKGPDRKPGYEVLYQSGKENPLKLRPDSFALHLIQQIRDEAHRFAITAHRQKQRKTRMKSSLESIPGVGAKRRRQLILHFGGLQELKGASLEEIAKVPGISLNLAQRIYDALH